MPVGDMPGASDGTIPASAEFEPSGTGEGLLAEGFAQRIEGAEGVPFPGDPVDHGAGSAGGSGGVPGGVEPFVEPPVWREASVVPRPAVPADNPRIAIIIDDWGYDWAAAPSFLSFPEPITVAVLPYLPRSVEQALRAGEAGFEVILHMPMEALGNSLDIGPGGLYVSMTDDEIAAAVRAALAAVPGVRGMNNHMGSLATTDPRVMRAALAVVREQGMFFVDSHTVSDTIAFRVAHELDVPYAVNQVFLDHENDETFIRTQIRRLINLALRQGAAVGIGHVRPLTYAALVDMLPEIKAAGIELVPVSQLLTKPAALRVGQAPSGVNAGTTLSSESQQAGKAQDPPAPRVLPEPPAVVR